MTGAQKEAIHHMRRRGLSYSAIGDAVRLPQNTVKSYCRRENICVKDSAEGGVIDTCDYCGKPLEHHPGKKKKLFCDDKCRTVWWNANRSCARCRSRGEGVP